MGSPDLPFPTWMDAGWRGSMEALHRLGREWAESGRDVSAIPTRAASPATPLLLDDTTIGLDLARPGLCFFRARPVLGGALSAELGGPAVTRLCRAPWAALALLLGLATLNGRAELAACAGTVLETYDALASFTYVDLVPTGSFVATCTGFGPATDDRATLDVVLARALEGFFAAWTHGFAGTTRERLERATPAALGASRAERDERALAYLGWLARASRRIRHAEQLTTGSLLRSKLDALDDDERERLAIGSIADALPLLLMLDRRL